MISPNIIILTKEEFRARLDEEFQRGVRRGRFEAATDKPTRAETPQSIPSEREEIVKWLDSQIIEHDRREPGSAFDSGRASAFYEAKQAIARGEHLTRQALEQGSVE